MMAHVHDVTGVPGTYVGTALYDVSAEHRLALAALVLVPLAMLVARGLPQVGHPARLRDLPVEHRVAVGALLTSALVHVLLLPGHGWSLWGLAFAADAALLVVAADGLVRRRPHAVGLAGVVLTGAVLALWVGLAAGQTPDQVAMATKAVELGGLVALAAGARRPAVATSGVVVVALLLVVPVWAVALEGEPPLATAMRVSADGSVPAHHGTAAGPGAGSEPEHPDADSDSDSHDDGDDEFARRVSAALARYADPAVAVADGYAAQDVAGDDFHADNSAYLDDGRILDPRRPETLVYAETPDGGAVLLGAMFQMPGLRAHGPEVAGGRAPWHSHEQICFGLAPPALAGATSPLGLCPAAAVSVPLTNEMLHVWTAPGVPSVYGDLPDGWAGRYARQAGMP